MQHDAEQAPGAYAGVASDADVERGPFGAEPVGLGGDGVEGDAGAELDGEDVDVVAEPDPDQAGDDDAVGGVGGLDPAGGHDVVPDPAVAQTPPEPPAAPDHVAGPGRR